ncbi:MAG: hypothetical protein WD686_04135 [Candidatus Woykebacteria bacterium]
MLLLALLSLIPTVFLPINLTLLALPMWVFKAKSGKILVLVMGASFFTAIFGDLNFGLVLIGFSLCIGAFMLLKKALPERGIFGFSMLILTLIIWEIIIRGELLVYSKVF